MKNSRNFLIVAMLIISAQSLCAKNKEQIFISNDYGQDVAASLVWESESIPYLYRYQDIYIPNGLEADMHKAPISGYKLVSMDVTPY